MIVIIVVTCFTDSSIQVIILSNLLLIPIMQSIVQFNGLQIATLSACVSFVISQIG